MNNVRQVSALQLWLATQLVADRASRLVREGRGEEAVHMARRGYRDAHMEYIRSIGGEEQATWERMVRRAAAAAARRRGG